ncbi:hypothetical protein SAMN06264364_10710 [Quadrisphaera granulorum]|uniref:Homeodomain-like domain-containing protein n=1 Tax=Quadrisphaera granulorum TaxID=317664 RepID=A0A316ABR9_9ACTN|nr:hypothetical protein [Quadrisphaera granulorum]PWJ54314.1 hypothetical protein BXY45_10710 [Quadrisphaera granulorum]SZE96086.1 hypothetical protein SAMN06264364_10710 [Quadrisphaera granulorum]
MTFIKGTIPDTPETLAAAALAESEDTEWHVVSSDDEMVELRQAQQRLDESVAAARAAGRPWESVAVATGMTRQGATKRWSQLTRSAS